MAEKAKRDRSTALRNFTRNLNTLNELFKEADIGNLVTPQYEKVKVCYEKLEDAQDAFISAADQGMDIDNDPDGYPYMDDASAKYNAMLKEYAGYLKALNEVQHAEDVQKRKDDAVAEREIQQKLEEDRAQMEQQLRKAERKEKFDSAAAELKLALTSFSRVNRDFDSSFGDAALSDARKEWNRIQSEFSKLNEP